VTKLGNPTFLKLKWEIPHSCQSPNEREDAVRGLESMVGYNGYGLLFIDMMFSLFGVFCNRPLFAIPLERAQMWVVIVSQGSRGDAQPYVHLAAGMEMYAADRSLVFGPPL